MKVYGQLEVAQAEIVSSDPSLVPVGRLWFNKVDGYYKISDEGNAVTKFLLNDDKIIIGTNGTAASNVRLNRAGAGIFQVVLGDDITAEGSLSAAPAIISSRQESYVNASLPTAGHVGRLSFVTDQGVLKVDDGTAFRSILTSNGTTYDAQSQKIINGVDPTSAQDLATKAYVDANGATNGPIPVTSKTTNYTATTSDQLILCDAGGGAFVVTLFTAVGNSGKKLIIKKTDGFPNTVLIDGNAAETIDGETTVSLYGFNETITIVSNGTNWNTIDWYDQIKYFIAKDLKASGTQGGGCTALTFNTRVLNTVQRSAPWAALASNQITLQPGAYKVIASAPALNIDFNRIRFRNITDSTTAILGSNVYASSIAPSSQVEACNAYLDGVVTISSAKVFELQHYTNSTRATNGLGFAVGDGESEVYAQITIERINPRSS